ncbi:MAG: ribosome small subunit-dependent GTPase A [Synechococcaceae cyanobacterium]|jgi:ribosome biogenesis GTPase
MAIASDPPTGHAGLVVALEANYCRVVLDQLGPGGVASLLCTRRRRLDKSGQEVCVGDRVGLEGIDWPAARAAVASLAPRRNRLERPSVANVSRVVVVGSLADPRPDPQLLSRFLLAAENLGAEVLLVFTKADLVSEQEQRRWFERVSDWGYSALVVSCQRPSGIEALRQRLIEPGISVLCGPSGVGKSSLLNALCPGLGLRVAAVSGRLRRGRHTTRHVGLYSLEGGGMVVDSPGFNRPELPGDAARLQQLFPELRQRLSQAGCRFADCRHLGDPGCVAGSSWDRQGIYAQCLAELERQLADRPMPPQRARQGSVRQRGDRTEPLLDPRWRRLSRRRQRQDLGPQLQGPGLELSPPDQAG